MQNIIFAWRQDSRLSRFQSRHRCYSNQMWKLSSTNLVSFMKSFSLIDESLCHRRILFSSSHESLASISHLLLEQFIDFYRWSIRANLMFDNFHICYSTRYIDESFDISRNTRSSLLDAFATITHHHSRFSLMIAHRHSTLSSRSLIDFRNISHDRSSSLDVLVTIAHRRSTQSSRSLIVARRTRHDRSRSLESFIHDRSTLSAHSSRSLIVTREFLSWSLDVISDRPTSTEVVKKRLTEAREDFKEEILSRF